MWSQGQLNSKSFGTNLSPCKLFTYALDSRMTFLEITCSPC